MRSRQWGDVIGGNGSPHHGLKWVEKIETAVVQKSKAPRDGPQLLVDDIGGPFVQIEVAHDHTTKKIG